MKAPSAHWAKKPEAPKRRDKPAAIVYTIDGEKLTFPEVCAAVRAAYPLSGVADKTVKARLERGRRLLSELAADALPAYRPIGLRR